MDRLAAMQVFVAVAEQGSFAAAARRLSLSAAQATRAVAALEAHVGARLLHRTTRVVRVSEAGATYLAHCKRILAEIAEAEALAATDHSALTGQLSVTAPVLFGRLHVAPVLLEFSKRHPGLTVRALFADRVIDLLDQNLDVAIRIAHLSDSGLHAVKVGAVRRVVCGSPAYLRAHSVPKHPRELADHALIAFSGLGEPRSWSFSVAGRPENFRPRPRLIVNTADVAVAAAVGGHGLTQVLSYQVEEAVRAKRLRVVLAEFELAPTPVHVVHVEGKGAAVRVRAFVDFAVDRLRSALTRVDEAL